MALHLTQIDRFGLWFLPAHNNQHETNLGSPCLRTLAEADRDILDFRAKPIAKMGFGGPVVHLIPKLEKSVKTTSALNATMPSVRKHGRTTHGHSSEFSILRYVNLFLRIALLVASATVVAWRWMLLMLPLLTLGAAIALYLHFSRPQDSL